MELCGDAFRLGSVQGHIRPEEGYCQNNGLSLSVTRRNGYHQVIRAELPVTVCIAVILLAFVLYPLTVYAATHLYLMAMEEGGRSLETVG